MPDERLGASFSIDVTQLKTGLKTANRLIRESESQFKKAAAGMQDWTKSETGLRAKLSQLNQTVDIQREKVRALSENYEKELADGMDETSDRAIYLRTQLNNEEAALKKNEEAVKDTEKALDELGDEAEDAGESANVAKEGFTVFKGVLSNLITDVLRRAVDALKELAKQTIEAGASFEAAMSQVAAVSGATGDELNALTEKAEEMGAKTKFSATESAEAFNYMAMAGWKTEDMLGGIEGIMNLAAASGSDLATTSDIVTDALTAMGYAASDSGRLADVMAAASSNANTNVEMMGQTFQYAAPIVGALGYSMEDTAVAIGMMANAGIKGEKAGTALRSILTRLSAPPKECADALDELGVSMLNSDGTMKSLDTVMQDLTKAFAGLSETEQTATAKHIAGQEAMSGLLSIVNAAPADYEKLTKAVAGSEGAAQKMADTMNDNVQGAMTIFKSQVEGVQISIFNKLEPALRAAIKSASNLVSDVNWESFGNKAKNALNKVMDGLEWIVKNKNKVVGGLKLVVGAFVAAKVLSFTKALSGTSKAFISVAKQAIVAATATNTNTAAEGANTAGKVVATGATTALTLAQQALNAAWKANPIGLVVAGLTALVSVIAVAVKSTKNLTEEEKAHQEALQEQRQQLEQNRESWDSLVESQKSAIDVGMTEISHLQSLWNELKQITDENGKVKEGYEQRASFITETLSDALGVEIGLTDNIIQGYKDVQTEIENTIDKKRAMTYLESQEELYTEALNNRAAAYEGLTTAQEEYDAKAEELAALEQERNELLENSHGQYSAQTINNITSQIEARQREKDEAEKNLQDQTDLYEEYLYNIGNYERNYALFHDNNFSAMSTATWDYVKEYQSSGEAMKAQSEANIAQLEYELNWAKEKYATTGDEVYQTIITNKEQQLAEERSKMAQYQSVTEQGLGATKIVWSDNLDDTLSEITGRNIEFQDAGDGLVQAVVDGEAIGAPKSKDEMASLIDDTIAEIATDENIDTASQGGKDIVNGVKNGINDNDAQNGAFGAIKNFASDLLSKLKSALQEHSPSKATKEMGAFLIEGLGVGIDSMSGWFDRKVKSFGKGVLTDFSKMNEQLQSTITPTMTVQGGVGSSFGGLAGNRSVVVNQYNTYAQAHSRYELYKTKQQTAAAVRLALGTV